MSSYPLNNTVNNSDSGGGGGGGGGSSTSSSTTSATNNNNNSGGNHHRLHWMNWPFGDTTFTKVFVGGLAWETQSHTLRRHFEQFGDILEAVVISDKNTGRSKGYGFVTFRDAESARRACGDPNPIIDGRRANCNLASLGGRSHPHHHHHHHLPIPSPPPPPPPLPFHYAGHLRSPAAAPPPPPPFPFGSNSSSSRSPGPRSRGATTFNATPAAAYHQPLPYTYQPGFVYTPYGNSHYPYLAFRRFPSKEGPHQYGTYGSEYAHPQGPYTPYAVQQYVHLYGMPGMVNPGMNSRGQLGQTVPGFHGYTAVQSYGLPGHNVVQLGGPAYRTSTTTIPVIQAPHPSGIATPDPGQSQTTVSAHSPQFTSGSDQDSNR